MTPAINNIASIYRPKIRKAQKKDFKDLLARINSIRDNQLSVVGCSYVLTNKTGKWTPVVVVEKSLRNSIRFKELSDWSSFEVLRLLDGDLSKIGFVGGDIIDPSGKSPKIQLSYLGRNDPGAFKYAGYLLIKTIQQVFERTCQGRIYVFPSNNAIGFYEKLGFVPVGMNMELTPEASAGRLEDVRRNPIGLPADLSCYIL